MQGTITPYSWERFTGRIPCNAVHTSENYVVIRAHHADDWMTGKFNIQQGKAYVAYDSKEIEVTSHIEVLASAPGTTVEWVPASHGKVPHGAVGPFGKDNVFVGRAVCPKPEGVCTPGKIHPGHRSLYMPFDGKEVPFETYEACVISAPLTRWERFHGKIPHHAVFASCGYAVIRAHHGNDWIPGKLNVKDMKAYVAYDMKEVEVTSNVEILLHAPGTEARWVPASDGNVPSGAVGPFGTDNVYIGRAVCPKPEGVYTPGKIHPGHNCLYMPFDGKEVSFKVYETLVIVPSGRF